jgi:uncharacterized membrane protein
MPIEIRLRAGVLVGLALLIAAVATWILTPVPSLPRALWVAIVTLPLWIFVPALKRGERRRYAALTLCLVPYLMLALMEVIANPTARITATAMLLLAFGVFVLAILYLRVTRPTPEDPAAPSSN